MRHQTLLMLAFSIALLVIGLQVVPSRSASRSAEHVTIPGQIRRIVASGSGMMRLLVYLQATELVVGVDDIESRGPRQSWTAPYRLAHPELATLPVVGMSNGRDNPELLLGLDIRPDLIVKSDTPGLGLSPDELRRRTNIRVETYKYGDLGRNRAECYQVLRELGERLDRRKRADEVIAFIESEIADLSRRVQNLSPTEQRSVYLGGVSFRGSHGLQSTSPQDEPFGWVRARNVASVLAIDGQNQHQAMVAGEKILQWDPDFVFLDMGTLTLPNFGAAGELQDMPLYRSLRAVREGRVYMLLPRASYNTNFDSQLANAWYIGKILYPDRFSDIDPKRKADEIFSFLNGRPLLDELTLYSGRAIFSLESVAPSPSR